MTVKLFFDLSRLDQKKIQISREEIRRINEQRYEFEQIDGVFLLLPEELTIIGYKDVRSDEFWVRGHLPGNPILPGVLMIEAAAQLCSIYQQRVCPPKGFFGFGGVDRVKFRALVRPGERLILIGRGVQVHPRRSIFDVQGVVGDRIVFEAKVTGIAMSEVARGAETR
jgi:3-hydroxyacyl-[acyl-carrier-protein] dehydratase